MRTDTVADRGTDTGTGADTGTSTGAGTVRRNVALDGLRGFALLGMLAWHAEIGWVRGGFARMTIFFVLSGYLATRSWQRHPGDGLGRFWLRRTLRLLPMTLVGVAVAVGVTLVSGTEATRASLQADALSVLTYTSNLHFLDTGQSYGALFERQSAFQHYWSLSIEEQLFVTLPLVLLAATAVSRRLRAPTWKVLTAATAVTAAVAAIASNDPDVVYFGTHTRLVEFLAGAALAAAAAGWTNAGVAGRSRLRSAGRIGAAVIVLALVLVDRDTAWLYDGWILLFCIPVVAVVASLEVGDPILGPGLSIRPLAWVGRAALSIYVLHWPVFVWIESSWPALPHTASVALKVVVAMVVGGLAHRLVERPMLDDTRARLAQSRRRAVRTRLVPLVGSGFAIAVAVVAIPSVRPSYAFDEAASAFEAARAGPPVVQDDEPRLAVFGGSTALMNSLGMMDWSRATGDVVVVSGDARLGCGLLTEGRRPVGVDERGHQVWVDVDDECGDWRDGWRERSRAGDVDVAVVFLGVWEIADWLLPGAEVPTSLESPVFAAALEAALLDGLDQLRAGGVDRILLMSTPTVGPGESGAAAAERGLPADHARRSADFNALLATVAGRSDDVELFDYASRIDSLDPEQRQAVQPDGVHLTWESAREFWSGPAGDELVALVVDGR